MEELMEEQVFEISLEMLNAVPEVVGVGFAVGLFVVLASGLMVACVKTFFRMIGGR